MLNISSSRLVVASFCLTRQCLSELLLFFLVAPRTACMLDLLVSPVRFDVDDRTVSKTDSLDRYVLGYCLHVPRVNAIVVHICFDHILI